MGTLTPLTTAETAARLRALGLVEDAQSSGRVLKHAMIAGGLGLMLLFGAPVWIAAFSPVYALWDYGWVWHLRQVRARGQISMARYRLLILHHASNVAGFGVLPLTISMMDWAMAMVAAVTLVVAQAFHNLAYEVRSRDQFIASYAVMAIMAQMLAAEVAPDATPLLEQLFIHLVFAAVSGFGAIAGLQANRTQRSLEETSAMLAMSRRGDAVNQLSSGIAHDFNNLLTVLRGNIDLIDEVPDAERVRLIAEIKTATNRGAHLVAHLMSGARRGPPETTSIDLAASLTSFADFARRVLPANIALTVDSASDITLRTQVAQLEAALLNLIVNARDAMPQGGAISISARSVPRRQIEGVLIQVSDTGPGMPPEILDRALEAYVTTKADGKGTGLGLPMVRIFADTHGGEVTLNSALGQGVQVDLWLPL
ncbi:hypothetical protein JANAI62_26500 [Jannaschia pagri]|uniref:histidine kinase n=1 Tax=Jannaschia pagri TaxID=2829797 RepID=A0ABQ4NPM0_9RHOB|nr:MULTISPECIES: ATP-binding protein [unclassified Jannaschia]GIT92192.1 hypothetical protein JANAI61_26500 [Jannaschia sp. AI_61]GIT96027.1 hypothetical protein JANAI62_26500 [Jannaschia sp. AI_62]